MTPVAVTTRLARVRDHLEGEMAAVLGGYGLTAPTFVMLTTLARLQEPGEEELAAELALTPGTIAGRVERLVGDGLVQRGAGGTVALTARGAELVDEVVPAHLENQARLLAALTRDEQAELGNLLRKLLLALEG